MLTKNGKNNSNGDFDWKDAFIDAGIMAGLSFFTVLGALAITQVMTDPIRSCIAAGLASATEFFLILAIKRGLREKIQ